MLNYSPTELYFYFRFGCTTPLELIFLSDTFQFVIYTILSYPFAWVISRQKNEEKKLLDFFIAAYPEPAAIFPRYQWI